MGVDEERCQAKDQQAYILVYARNGISGLLRLPRVFIDLQYMSDLPCSLLSRWQGLYICSR